MTEQAPKLGPQLCSSLVATLGGLLLGTAVGWFSPADKLLQNQLPEEKETHLFSFISSIMPLGGAVSCLLMGIILNFKIPRKALIFCAALGMIVTWTVLIFCNSAKLYCAARFYTGFFCSTFCVSVPTYVGEIAHKSVRGMLGTFFQFQVVIGILISFSLGEFHNLYGLNIPCLFISILLAVLILFVPETPVYYLMVKQRALAEKSLIRLRGQNYSTAQELNELDDYTQPKEGTFCFEFKKTATWKGFLILTVLHIIQQLSGINVVMFFAHRIFEMSGSTLQPGISSIILAFVQVIATAISIPLVDRCGRKIMWYISLIMMAVSLLVLSVYFYIKSANEETANTIGYLPVIFVNMYLIGFSLGTGPLPWVTLGEILPNSVKFLGSICTSINLILCFLVTFSFTCLVDTLGAGLVFNIYAIFCILGFLFVFFVCIETKNKTLAEIQEALGSK